MEVNCKEIYDIIGWDVLVKLSHKQMWPTSNFNKAFGHLPLMQKFLLYGFRFRPSEHDQSINHTLIHVSNFKGQIKKFKDIVNFFNDGGKINFDGTLPFKDICDAPKTVVKVNYVLRQREAK